MIRISIVRKIKTNSICHSKPHLHLMKKRMGRINLFSIRYSSNNRNPKNKEANNNSKLIEK